MFNAQPTGTVISRREKKEKMKKGKQKEKKEKKKREEKKMPHVQVVFSTFLRNFVSVVLHSFLVRHSYGLLTLL